jgi:hypothetical protein
MKRTFVLLEEDPHRRYDFFLQFPTMLFYGGPGLKVAFAEKPIQSLHDTVYCPPMPNAHMLSWQICGCGASSLSYSTELFWTTAATPEATIGADMLKSMFRIWFHSFSYTRIAVNFRKWEKISKKKNGLEKIIKRMKMCGKENHTKQPLDWFIRWGEDREKINFNAEYTQ